MSLLSRHHRKSEALRPSRIDAQIPALETKVGAGTKTAMLANHSAREVTMSCCLDGPASKWGKHEQLPAGILSLILDLDQGRRQRVCFFKMEVTLHEEDPRQPATNLNIKARELYLIQLPAPRSDFPDAVVQHMSQESSLAPQVESPFGGGSLGHQQRSKQWDQHLRPWKFSSHWNSSTDDVFDIARWTWEVPREYPNVELSGPLYAAMALRTPKNDFFLTCQIVQCRVRDDDARMYRMARDCKKSRIQHIRRLIYENRDEDISKDIAGLDIRVKDLRKAADQQARIIAATS